MGGRIHTVVCKWIEQLSVRGVATAQPKRAGSKTARGHGQESQAPTVFFCWEAGMLKSSLTNAPKGLADDGTCSQISQHHPQQGRGLEGLNFVC